MSCDLAEKVSLSIDGELPPGEARAIEGLHKTFIASIGPTTTESLEELGVPPQMEPSHPKLGILVKEAAERCRS